MNLFEIYIKEIYAKQFFKELQDELLAELPLDEADETGEDLKKVKFDPKLQALLDEAEPLVFKKFGINPKDKVYFIAGSAALYIFPNLREKFELKGTIGDLDIIIPDTKYWEKAGLKGQTIYRPKEDNSIEAFTTWDPAKAGKEYANAKVRSTNEILKDAFQVNGYWFMSLQDIIDYKTKLGRTKESDILDLIAKYKLDPSTITRREILKYFTPKQIRGEKPKKENP